MTLFEPLNHQFVDSVSIEIRGDGGASVKSDATHLAPISERECPPPLFGGRSRHEEIDGAVSIEIAEGVRNEAPPDPPLSLDLVGIVHV